MGSLLRSLRKAQPDRKIKGKGQEANKTNKQHKQG